MDLSPPLRWTDLFFRAKRAKKRIKMKVVTVRNDVSCCQLRGARVLPDGEDEGGALAKLAGLEQTASRCDPSWNASPLGLIALGDL